VLAGYKLLPEYQRHPVAGAFVRLIIVAVGVELHHVDVGSGK